MGCCWIHSASRNVAALRHPRVDGVGQGLDLQPSHAKAVVHSFHVKCPDCLWLTDPPVLGRRCTASGALSLLYIITFVDEILGKIISWTRSGDRGGWHFEKITIARKSPQRSPGPWEVMGIRTLLATNIQKINYNWNTLTRARHNPFKKQAEIWMTLSQLKHNLFKNCGDQKIGRGRWILKT
jgi:hypothetical protein